MPMQDRVACEITPENIRTVVVDLNNGSCETVSNSALGVPLELEYLGACTKSSQETLSSLMTGCLAANKSQELFCSHSVTEDSFYAPCKVDCFWESRNVCITYNTNMFDEPGSGAPSGVFCNSSFHDLTVLLYSDSNSSRYLEICLDTSFNHDNYTIGSGENSNSSFICESFSGPPYNCFWNPNSRITGEYCPRCEPLCRSSDHSLNFIQFAVGVSLITPGFVMSRIALTLLTSDAMGDASQVSLMCILCYVRMYPCSNVLYITFSTFFCTILHVECLILHVLFFPLRVSLWEFWLQQEQ